MNIKIADLFVFIPKEFSALSLLTFFLLIFLLITVALQLLQNKYLRHILRKLDKSEAGLKEEIRTSVQPKFLETSIEAKDLIDLAIEIWRIDKRFNKATERIDENARKAIENSMQKIRKFIDRYDLEVRDYTGQKYNSGLSAIDVISVEKNKRIKEDVIKETVEPMILLKGQIIKKARVIILSKG